MPAPMPVPPSCAVFQPGSPLIPPLCPKPTDACTHQQSCFQQFDAIPIIQGPVVPSVCPSMPEHPAVRSTVRRGYCTALCCCNSVQYIPPSFIHLSTRLQLRPVSHAELCHLLDLTKYECHNAPTSNVTPCQKPRIVDGGVQAAILYSLAGNTISSSVPFVLLYYTTLGTLGSRMCGSPQWHLFLRHIVVLYLLCSAHSDPQKKNNPEKKK